MEKPKDYFEQNFKFSLSGLSDKQMENPAMSSDEYSFVRLIAFADARLKYRIIKLKCIGVSRDHPTLQICHQLCSDARPP